MNGIRRHPHGRIPALLIGLGLAAACGGDATGTDSQPPVVTIEAPEDGSSYELGDTITFQGSAVDPEDGPITGAALVWSSDADGEFGTGPEVTTAELTATLHIVYLTAVDSDGVPANASITVRIMAPPGSRVSR